MGPELGKAADHFGALREFGLDPVWVASPGELADWAVDPAVVVAAMSGSDGDCGVVREIARMFPGVAIVALLACVSVRSVNAAIRCGACTVVDVAEPAVQAAETVYQASIGFPRFPMWLLRASSFDVGALTAQDVSWLRLLADPGLTVSDIAGRVGWSKAQFHRRVRPLYRLLGVANRRDAVLRAREHGILP